jgi:hypothetical protein
MSPKNKSSFVQIGAYSIRGPDGGLKPGVPLYMRVTDEKAFNAEREKLMRKVSQVLVEQYSKRVLSRPAE